MNVNRIHQQTCFYLKIINKIKIENKYQKYLFLQKYNIIICTY